MQYNQNILDIYLNKKDEIIAEQKENHAKYLRLKQRATTSSVTQNETDLDDQPDITSAENETNFNT